MPRSRKTSVLMPPNPSEPLKSSLSGVASEGSTVVTVTTVGGGKSKDGFIPAGQNLIEEEKAAVGGVKWAIYGYYAQCIGVSMGAGALLLYLGYQVC